MPEEIKKKKKKKKKEKRKGASGHVRGISGGEAKREPKSPKSWPL